VVPAPAMDTLPDVCRYPESPTKRTWFMADASVLTTPRDSTARIARTFTTIYRGNPRSANRRTLAGRVIATITPLRVTLTRRFTRDREECLVEFATIASTIRGAKTANSVNRFIITT